jgi:iron complex outermembrane receptor protein
MDSSLAVNKEKIQPETMYPSASNPYHMRKLFHLVHILSFFRPHIMKIISLRQATLLMLPAILPLPLLAADNDNTLVVTAAPPETGLNELDTPAALSVVSGDDMRQAAPRVNLSENLSSVPGLQIQNRQSYVLHL